MCSRLPSATRARPGQAGFTLVELMVGVAIGLLASLAVTQVLVTSDTQKRTTTTGSEAQVNGALALGDLQRRLMAAGYGFSSSPTVIGCTVRALFNKAAVAGFPTRLVPVEIVQGSDTAPADAIRILGSGKASYSVPLRVTSSYTSGSTSFQVTSGLSVEQGDLVFAARTANEPCELFQVTGAPSAAQIPRADVEGAWNPPNFPRETYPEGSQLLNFGAEPLDVTYRVTGTSLRVDTLRIAADGSPAYEANVERFPDVVNLQALYGKDTNLDGTVDRWDTVTPTTNPQWRELRAVRIALVVRSAQIQGEDVTHANPMWNLGTGGDVPDHTVCGRDEKCLPLRVDHLADWRRYRYRVFDTTVPLRNMVWTS